MYQYSGFDEKAKIMKEERHEFLEEMSLLRKQGITIKHKDYYRKDVRLADTYFYYNGYMGCVREEFNMILRERGNDYVFFMRENGEFCRYTTDEPMFPYAEKNSIHHIFTLLAANGSSVSEADFFGNRTKDEDGRIVAQLFKEKKAVKDFLAFLESKNDPSLY